ncbi:hypothetical protein VTN02DRAFT_3673 [Thermoascus thermophilus]
MEGSELIGAPSPGGSTGHAGRTALSNHGGIRLRSSAPLENSLYNTLSCVDLVRRRLRFKTCSHILPNLPSTPGIRELYFSKTNERVPFTNPVCVGYRMQKSSQRSRSARMGIHAACTDSAMLRDHLEE